MSTVLLIGSGGREHALAWKLAQSPRLTRLIVVPGNDGMPRSWERWAMPINDRKAFEAVAERAKKENVGLAVIGPDNPLADGIVDVFEVKGIPSFGPSAAAARIEASKGFAKEVMRAARVPTAEYVNAPDKAEAERYLKSAPWPKSPGAGWVLKADGLALGKGVHVCGNLDEARVALKALPEGPLVIEQRLRGEELSWMAFCDGERCALLQPARDYKRLRTGDEGPNTGGMGAFSPVPGVPAHWPERMRNEVFLPTLAEMKKRGTPFKGLLYAGIMADFARDQFWVLEFNARFGDPETQVLMPRMNDDLVAWCEGVARGDISSFGRDVAFREECAVAVVAAAGGYPEAPEKEKPITGIAGAAPRATSELDYFFAGVSQIPSGTDGQLQSSGGRVLAACGMAEELSAARSQAYQRLAAIRFEGMQSRADIAQVSSGDFGK